MKKKEDKLHKDKNLKIPEIPNIHFIWSYIHLDRNLKCCHIKSYFFLEFRYIYLRKYTISNRYRVNIANVF